MTFITMLVLDGIGEIDIPTSIWGVLFVLQLLVWGTQMTMHGRSLQRISRLESAIGVPDGSKGVER